MLTRRLIFAAVLSSACQLSLILPAAWAISAPVHEPVQLAAALTQKSVSQEILKLTNAERAKVGLKPLKLQAQLSQAAQQHAVNMVRTGIFEHVIQGIGPAARVTATGYRWRAVAENIAYGQTSASRVMQTWIQSPGHKANILGNGYTDLGIGLALNASGRPYWVQVFGRAS
jgi:uncharacterized protein YkwD